MQGLLSHEQAIGWILEGLHLTLYPICQPSRCTVAIVRNHVPHPRSACAPRRCDTAGILGGICL